MRIAPTAAQRPEMPSEPATTSSSPENAISRTRGTEREAGDVVSLKSLEAQTMALPEVRQEKVQKLKEEIAGGKYHVDPKKVADAMLNH